MHSENVRKLGKQLLYLKGVLEHIRDRYAPVHREEHRRRAVRKMMCRHRARIIVAVELSAGVTVNVHESRCDKSVHAARAVRNRGSARASRVFDHPVLNLKHSVRYDPVGKHE